jgi:hypothetical protein
MGAMARDPHGVLTNDGLFIVDPEQKAALAAYALVRA